MQRFVLTPDKQVVFTLTTFEADLFRQLTDELRPVIGDPTEAQPRSSQRRLGSSLWHGDPVRDRMFPRAYMDSSEDKAEDQWQRMVHPDLVGEKLVHIDRVLESLDRTVPATATDFPPDIEGVEITLSEEETVAWMGVIQDARITLGFSLDVTEEREPVDPQDPRAAGLQVYDYLSGLQEELVQVISSFLRIPPS